MNVSPTQPDLLSGHSLFEGTPASVLAPLSALTRELHLSPGDVVFREGDPADGLYLLAAGTVLIAATRESGDTALAHVNKNELFGEMGVLDGEPRSGTATAVGLCVAYFIPAEPFLDVVEESSAVGMRLLANLAMRLRRMNGRLVELPAGATFTAVKKEAGE